MARGGFADAFADAPRLEHIVERQVVGDALGLDAQRARRQQRRPSTRPKPPPAQV